MSAVAAKVSSNEKSISADEQKIAMNSSEIEKIINSNIVNEIATLKAKVAELNFSKTNGIEIVEEFFYTNPQNIDLTEKNVWYCWSEFIVEVGETIDFKAMAAIFSQHDNINFILRLI